MDTDNTKQIEFTYNLKPSQTTASLALKICFYSSNPTTYVSNTYFSITPAILGNVIPVGCDMVKFYINTFGSLKDRKTHNCIKYPRSTVKYIDNAQTTDSHRDEHP